jgi:regulator of sigma D
MDTAEGTVQNSRQGTHMSYAYIEGQEAAALDFFEKRLQQAIDPEERRELSALVEKLRRKLQDKNELAKSLARVLANGISNAA